MTEGLRPGRNVIRAKVRGQAARITVTNHRSSGPVIAGRQVQPWVCLNREYGLGAAKDRACTTKPRFLYFYKSASGGELKGYDTDNPPADVATTTNDRGVEAPYIVRRERGVIDRGVYDVAVLFDPAKMWDRWKPQPRVEPQGALALRR